MLLKDSLHWMDDSVRVVTVMLNTLLLVAFLRFSYFYQSAGYGVLPIVLGVTTGMLTIQLASQAQMRGRHYDQRGSTNVPETR